MPTSDDLTARLFLAATTEPADPTTGTLLAAVGPDETARLATSTDPLPREIGTAEGDLWRARLAPRAHGANIDRILHDTDRHELQILTPDSPHWPLSLRDLRTSAPIALWVKGDTDLLNTAAGPRIAFVGARAATGYGEHVTTELVSHLALTGHSIVSGGSYGIDAAAHRAALTASSGSTIAVLAGGLDRYYPSGNQELLQRVAQHGLVVSEMPPGATPTRWRFLNRNRLLAALAEVTVVAEAGWRSGSLNVAAHARALDRPVGAIPGPITSAASTGCHRLLHDGVARIVTTAADITELLTARIRPAALEHDLHFSPASNRIPTRSLSL